MPSSDVDLHQGFFFYSTTCIARLLGDTSHLAILSFLVVCQRRRRGQVKKMPDERLTL